MGHICYTKKIKHSMLCVTGVSLGDITNMIFLNFALESMLSECLLFLLLGGKLVMWSDLMSFMLLFAFVGEKKGKAVRAPLAEEEYDTFEWVLHVWSVFLLRTWKKIWCPENKKKKFMQNCSRNGSGMVNSNSRKMHVSLHAFVLREILGQFALGIEEPGASIAVP